MNLILTGVKVNTHCGVLTSNEIQRTRKNLSGLN